MKEESNGEVVRDFAGFTPKMYTFLKVNDKHERQANGTKMWVIKQKFQFWDYTKCVKHINILVIIEVHIFSIYVQY